MNDSLQTELRPAKPSWKRFWPAGLAVCCGLGFSLAVFFVLHGWESRDIEKAFCVESANRAAAVKNVFETQLSLLESVQAAFDSVPRLNRGEFQTLLEPFHSHARSIVAVEWVPRVAHDRRQEYETAARRDGIENFQFTTQDSRGKIAADARRAEYFPVYFIGPGPGDPAVFGYDLASEPTRLEAVCNARDTGKIQVSGRIALIQEEKNRDGFLILLPVYERGKPRASLEDRRRNFRGAVVGVFRPDILIETALTRLQPEGIDVALFDSSLADGKLPFYFHASRNRPEMSLGDFLSRCDDPHLRHYCSGLEIAGHSWTIECIPIPEFIAARQTWWPWATLAAGMAFTAMFAAYVMLSLDRRAFAERLVHEKDSTPAVSKPRSTNGPRNSSTPRKKPSNAWLRPRSGATRKPACTSAAPDFYAKPWPRPPDGPRPKRRSSARPPSCTTSAKSASPTPSCENREN